MQYTPRIPDLVGYQVDQYRILNHIGTGGSGVVYLAQSNVNGTHVAIKILSTPLDTQNISSFITEAQSIHLEHPHIVRIKKFGQYQNYPFFVMAYLVHGNLRQRHPKGSKLSWDTLLPYIRQITDALQYVHDQGMVHRDVKPENMLIDEHGAIKLSDFGIAITSYTINPQTQLSSGTIFYIAPEQIQGMAVRESDQYGLGSVIYEWLTGQPVFMEGKRSILDQHLSTRPVPPRNINPTIHPLVDALVMKTLAKHPHERFANMREFLLEVERVSIVMMTTIIVKAQIANFTGHSDTVQTLMCSPDNKYIASAGNDKVVHVWDATTGQVIYTYHGHTATLWSLAWSPDSRSLLSAGEDEIVHIWEATTGVPLASHAEHRGTIRAVAWSPKRKYVASAGDDKAVKVWDVQNRRLLHSYEEHSQSIFCLAWSPDGSYLASGDNAATVRVWEALTGNYVRVYRKHTERVTALSWSPDGKYIASASDDNTIHVWERDTGKQHSVCTEHTDVVSSIAWSPDGRHLTSGSWDKTVRLWEWDATQGAKWLHTYTGHTNWVNTVSWSPDSRRIVSGSWDKTVRIFSLDARS